MRIAVVGPCASGKSLLAELLREEGLAAYTVCQEHSGVSYLFRLRDPDAVVFLDVSYEHLRTRRRIAWGPESLARQKTRLERARRECDVYVLTDGLSPAQVFEQVVQALGLPSEVRADAVTRHWEDRGTPDLSRK